jgi:hypothetical protein
MSDLENLYQSPESPVIPEESQSSGVFLTETMLKHLNDASPWLRFVGIVGYINSAMIFFSGILMSIGVSASRANIDIFASSNFPIGVFSLLYIPMGVLFFFPSYFTYNFGKRIRNFKFNNLSQELELAFKNNKSLWKFYGILYIVFLAFIPVTIVISFIVAIVALTSGL